MNQYKMGSVVVIGLICSIASGCYSYVPAELDLVPKGDEVRLMLTRPGFAELPAIPNNSGPNLNGRVMQTDANGLLLRVPVAFQAAGFAGPRLDQDVPVPRMSVIQLERRVFNRGRTAIAVAGGIFAASAVFSGLRKGTPQNASDPEGIIDEEAGVGFSLSVLHYLGDVLSH